MKWDLPADVTLRESHTETNWARGHLQTVWASSCAEKPWSR